MSLNKSFLNLVVWLWEARGSVSVAAQSSWVVLIEGLHVCRGSVRYKLWRVLNVNRCTSSLRRTEMLRGFDHVYNI